MQPSQALPGSDGATVAPTSVGDSETVGSVGDVGEHSEKPIGHCPVVAFSPLHNPNTCKCRHTPPPPVHPVHCGSTTPDEEGAVLATVVGSFVTGVGATVTGANVAGSAVDGASVSGGTVVGNSLGASVGAAVHAVVPLGHCPVTASIGRHRINIIL